MTTELNKKPRAVHELQVYHTLIMFNREFVYSINRLQKDVKKVYGQEILRCVADCFSLIRTVYKEQDLLQKTVYMANLQNRLDNLDYFVRILKDCEYLTDKRYAVIAKYLGNVMEQINRWESSIKKSLNK